MITHSTCHVKTQAGVQEDLCVRLVLGRHEFYEEEEEKRLEEAQRRKEIIKNTKTWM